jgi:hypothetical protein
MGPVAETDRSLAMRRWEERGLLALVRSDHFLRFN